MEWVGETNKYYDRTLQVYRIRPTAVDDSEAAAPPATVL
jgi:hypothetical protein